MKTLFTCFLLVFTLSISAQIKKFNESASHFNTPIHLDSSRGIFPSKDMYRAYKKAGTGFSTVSKVQGKLEGDIRRFAKKNGKDFIVLGRESSRPPYIFGNYPAIEIIFVLVNKE